MDVSVSIDQNGTMTISADGVDKESLGDVVRELVFSALSTRRREKKDSQTGQNNYLSL